MKKYFVGLTVLLLIVLGVGLLHHDHKNTVKKQLGTHGSYAALGDSVAAAVGLKDDSDSSACGRTNESYANLVAANLHYRLSNLACSGASVPNGILGSQDVNDLQVTPQIQQLFKKPKPNLITITIGANDANWTKPITECYTSECGSAVDTAAVQANLAAFTPNLQTVLQQIHDHYAPSLPRIVVTGYYQVFPVSAATSCTDLNGVDNSELAWGREMQADISTTIKNVVSQYSFATYAPISFAGHELCTADSWVQGLADGVPYHPTASGQAQIAKQIEAVIESTK